MEKAMLWIGRLNKKEVFLICWILIPLFRGICDGALSASTHYSPSGVHYGYELFVVEWMNCFFFPFVMLFLRAMLRYHRNSNLEHNR